MKKETNALLKLRAVAMAKETEIKSKSGASVDIIAFTLSRENYGIESDFVSEVFQMKNFTPLPGLPPYILGLINIRRHILPVINLKKFFNIPEKGLGELNKVIILRNSNMEFGILADIVHGTQSIDIEDILETPPTVTGIGEKYLKGVTKEHLIILDAESLLSDESIIINEEIA